MIEVFFEEIEIVPEINEAFLSDWISKVVELEFKSTGDISFIFCSDEHLLEMNRTHLNHDYYTDIITFDYCVDSIVSGDLFISVDRVRENAELLSLSFIDELHRVCAHGVLHLCGYKDKSNVEELLMRKKEDQALSLR
jgi:probable rRNA maturation factor